MVKEVSLAADGIWRRELLTAARVRRHEKRINEREGVLLGRLTSLVGP